MSQHLTRRAALARVTTIAALTGAAAFPAVAIGMGDNDRRIAALLQQHNDIEEQHIDATERADLCDFATRDTWPKPRECKLPDGGTYTVHYWSDPYRIAQHFSGEALRTVLADFGAYKTEVDRIKTAHGWDALNAEVERLSAERRRIEDEIESTPPDTVYGALLKFRYAYLWCLAADPTIDALENDTGMGLNEDALAAVYRDLERMAGIERRVVS